MCGVCVVCVCGVCVCVCERERERERLCVYELERETERVRVCVNASYDIFMQRFGFMELAQFFEAAANLYDLSEIEVCLCGIRLLQYYH